MNRKPYYDLCTALLRDPAWRRIVAALAEKDRGRMPPRYRLPWR